MSDRYICLFLLFGFGFCSVVANSNHDVGTLVERVKTLEIDQSDLKETVRKLQEVVSSQQDTIKYQERQIQKLLDLEQDKNGRGSDQQKRIEGLLLTQHSSLRLFYFLSTNITYLVIAVHNKNTYAEK